MLAVIVLLCGALGLWINIYSIFAVALFGIYRYWPCQKAAWESKAAFVGFVLGGVNIIAALITKQF